MLTTQFAWADQIYNSLDASVDADFEVLPLTVGGSDGSVTLAYLELGGDGKGGCNLTGSGSQLVLGVSSSDALVATVSPSSVTFVSCGYTEVLTIHPVAAGTANVTLAFTSVTTSSSGATTSASYDLLPGRFTVSVTAPPPANTPPQVSITGVAHGAIYEHGLVPDAGCDVVDAEDGITSFAASLSSISGPLAAYFLGTQIATCSYTDAGGLNAVVAATYSISDTVPPEISLVSVVPGANVNGWNNTDVVVTWACWDAVTPVVEAILTDVMSGEGMAQTASATCADLSGNTAPASYTPINIDVTVPLIAFDSQWPPANGNGWNKTDVTLTWTCSDALSGEVDAQVTETVTSEGANQSATGTCVDRADNSATDEQGGIAIDKTEPDAPAFVGGPAAGGSYYFGFVPAAPTCSSSDALSGLVGCLVTGYSAAVGSHTLTATATDYADNESTATRTYTVLAWSLTGFYQPVDMGGVWNTVKGGSTVPFKFEVFAGIVELTDPTVVQSFIATSVTCPASGILGDAIEFTTTGATSLRYDWTAGQFVNNWQTPKRPGTCYQVTMTTQDGSTLAANFLLK
jgi:hypothetical protein